MFSVVCVCVARSSEVLTLNLVTADEETLTFLMDTFFAEGEKKEDTSSLLSTSQFQHGCGE